MSSIPQGLQPLGLLRPSAPLRFSAQPTPAKKILIALNPKAGGGVSVESMQQRIAESVARVARANPTLSLSPNTVEFTTLPPAMLAQKLKTDAPQYGRIIAAGGDGTVREVIRVSRQYAIPVGILPLGTGNRLVKELGLSDKFDKALETALTGHTHEIDVFTANGQLGLIAASTGIGEEVVRKTNERPDLKKKFGPLAYVIQGVQPFLKLPTHLYKITTDTGLTLQVRAAAISVVNGLSFGLMKAAPNARPDDGMLDVAIIGINGKHLPFLWQLLRGKEGAITQQSGIAHLQARSVTVESLDNPALPVDLDGDPAGTTPLTVAIDGKVPVVFPNEHKHS